MLVSRPVAENSLDEEVLPVAKEAMREAERATHVAEEATRFAKEAMPDAERATHAAEEVTRLAMEAMPDAEKVTHVVEEVMSLATAVINMAKAATIPVRAELVEVQPVCQKQSPSAREPSKPPVSRVGFEDAKVA